MRLKFLEVVKEKAKENPARMIFPETFDERTLRACAKIAKEKTAIPVLIGNSRKIKASFRRLRLSLDFSKIDFLDPEDRKLHTKYAAQLYELRKDKGLSEKEASSLIKNPYYFGVMAVEMGDGGGLIGGAAVGSADTLRPALQIIKTKEKFHKVSGFFFMVLEKRLLLFADCMVNIDPNSNELAEIAIDTAETATRFCLEPKIAMLSFSTNGGVRHPDADKVREATKMVNYFRPDLLCEGEMQVDAALVPEIAQRKFPKGKIQGDANVLIFPDLGAANISYKLVERLAGAEAIGPILQGLEKPINDLSRGCSVDDIVNLAAITTLEIAGMTCDMRT